MLLFSGGKDSIVLLRLAEKAFRPGRFPFPLLHIDTTWKFREMIEFRDRTAAELGVDLLVHTNEAGRAAGVTPFTHGTHEYTRIMKTVALRQALDAGAYDAAIGGARRDEERSRAMRSRNSIISRNFHVVSTCSSGNGSVDGWNAFSARCSSTELSLPIEYSSTGRSLSATASRRMWMLSASSRSR